MQPARLFLCLMLFTGQPLAFVVHVLVEAAVTQMDGRQCGKLWPGHFDAVGASEFL